jgi:hypothetical protein
MALGHTFYHASIKKMVVVFGNLFNDLYVRKFDVNGNEIERRKVPISFGPKEKFLARLDAGQFTQTEAISLPRMAFEMDALTYDAERKLNSLNTITNQKSGESVKYSFAPVPYNYDFSLYIMVKNADDGTQLLEQILPYFTPHFTVTINEFPELDIKRDIPIILNNLQLEDVYEGEFASRRSLIWTLTFTMKGNMYGSVRNGSLIQSTVLNTFKQNEDGSTVEDGSTTATVNDINGLTTDDFGFSQSSTPGETP